MRGAHMHPYRERMLTRTAFQDDRERPSPLVLRHLEDVFGTIAPPPQAVTRLARQDHWFGILPQLPDLTIDAVRLAERYRTLPAAARGHLLALAVDGGEDESADTGESVNAGFLEVDHRGAVRVASDLHRIAILAGAASDDHRNASHVPLRGEGLRDGGVLHRLFAAGDVTVDQAAEAAEHFVRTDRPSWAVHCLVRAADLATDPARLARLAADAANVAAFEGDFSAASRIVERYVGRCDTRVLVRATSTSRALRHLLVENDPIAARTAIVTLLRGADLDESSTGGALTVLALVNAISADPLAWEGFVDACDAVGPALHPDIAVIAATMLSLNEASGPYVPRPVSADGRGWAQLAACMAGVVHGFRDMRLGGFSPLEAWTEQPGNRLVRIVGAAFRATMLAQTQHWSELAIATAVVLETSEAVRSPILRVSAEAMLAVGEAYRGERDAAKDRVERIHGEPAFRRSHRLRAVIDSVTVMIEGSRGNYDHALALLSTREPDALNLTVGPYGPMELFDFVDYALMVQQRDEAALRVELSRDAMQLMRSERADFVLAACDTLLAARVDLTPLEDLLRRSDAVPFIYESARARLAYAERLRRARRITEARRQLVRVEADLMSVDAGAWLDRVHRELRACTRETPAAFVALTEQEMRIAELAARGLSNKQIGAELFLSPRTVGGHLYKVFPKLGIGTRAQLRDALTLSLGA